MRRLVAGLLALLLLCQPASAAIVVTSLGTKGGSSASSLTITLVTVAAGSLIVVGVRDSSTVVGGTVDDGGTNTYTRITSQEINNAIGTNGFTAVYYAWNTSAISGATITYTGSQSPKDLSMTAVSVTGIQTTSTPLDSAVTAGAGGSSGTPSVTSGVPAAAGELFIGILGTANTMTITQGSGWATPPTKISGSSGGVGGGNQVNSGTSALTFNPTIASQVWGAIVVGFKAVPTGGGGLLLRGVGN